MSTFQLTLIGVFIFALILGVLVFGGILPGFRAPAGGTGGSVTLWGTLPESAVNLTLSQFKKDHEAEFTLNYVAKDARSFESDFVEALASGNGPDLVLMPNELVNKHANKLLFIPFSSYSATDFQNNFVDQGRLYTTSEGAWALPVLVDPLVMYVNRDLLISGRVAQVPKTWTELQTAVKSLSVADNQSTLSQSAIALGTFKNITHAKDILTLLILQAGNPIVTVGNQGYESTLKDSLGNVTSPAVEAIDFFGRFVDPTSAVYSWNTAQPEARSAFTRGTLAFYLGYASELPRLKQQNPQLNIDVALVPQLAGRRQLTLGQLSGLSLVKSSQNVKTAYQVMTLLAGPQGEQALSQAAGLPAARRDLLKPVASDAAQTVFNEAAILAQGWLDPDPTATEAIFRTMVEAIQVRGITPNQAVTEADNQLDLLLK
jgi:ABC-type glycerol-3-phosphate transport system substrate-binding protein